MMREELRERLKVWSTESLVSLSSAERHTLASLLSDAADALALLEQEPVAWLVSFDDDTEEVYMSATDMWDATRGWAEDGGEFEVIPLVRAHDSDEGGKG